MPSHRLSSQWAEPVSFIRHFPVNQFNCNTFRDFFLCSIWNGTASAKIGHGFRRRRHRYSLIHTLAAVRQAGMMPNSEAISPTARLCSSMLCTSLSPSSLSRICAANSLFSALMIAPPSNENRFSKSSSVSHQRYHIIVSVHIPYHQTIFSVFQSMIFEYFETIRNGFSYSGSFPAKDLPHKGVCPLSRSGRHTASVGRC